MSILLAILHISQARGTRDSLTHDFIITCVYGQMGSDGHERKKADATLRTIFVPFEAKGVLYAWGPVQPANGPPTRTTSG